MCRQVKVLFVRNLANSVTEEILETTFGQFGKLERVKKLKDYAFIHFDERDGAVKVMTLRVILMGWEGCLSNGNNSVVVNVDRPSRK